ncbi:MAG: ABC transporter permease [Burkholderiaceae bacterium]|jgi:ABC-2 type transport system permease protein|nr:ABC transporter permease [Burkholderiaceae bacterium]
MRDYATQVFAVADAEMRKLRHDPWELGSRAIQPLLWLVLFGGVMSRARELAPPTLPYLDFLAPGILAQSVLFVAIFYGISAIWERDLGVLHRYMVSPAPRSTLVIGKALSSSVRGLSQALIVYLCAAAMGVRLSLAASHVIAVALLIVVGSGLFSTFSLIVACIVKTRERFMGIGQVLTMPIFFASNAIYPIDLMPPWLRTVASLNPLTYEVDALRAMMLDGVSSRFGIVVDFGVLVVASALVTVIATLMYPRMTR